MEIFSEATIFSMADGLTFSVGSIIVGGINTTHIPINGTSYITIGSVSAGSPLPIELISFNATPINNQSVSLVWQIAAEINNDYFTIS